MSIARSEIGGHAAWTVAGRHLSLTCLPGRGAHLTSLRQGGHEWLWVPPHGPDLQPVSADDDFDPHQEGGDDCFPTVTADVVRGVRYPDHGCVWHRPWRVVEAGRRLVLAIELPTCGLVCERSLAPDGDGLLLSWRIRNRTGHAMPYVWCWHPLLAHHPGDRLELPGVGAVHLRRRNPGPPGAWPQPIPGVDLSLGEIGPRPGLKAFAAATGVAVLHSGGRCLAMRWDPLLLPWAGLWVKGQGRRQWAVEPTNVRADRISALTSVPPEAVLPPHGVRSWSISLQPG